MTNVNAVATDHAASTSKTKDGDLPKEPVRNKTKSTEGTMQGSQFLILHDLQENFANMADEIQILKDKIQSVEGPSLVAKKNRDRSKEKTGKGLQGSSGEISQEGQKNGH